MHLQCIHGNVHLYPVTEVELTLRGHMRRIRVGVAKTMAYLVILGQDVDEFGELAKVWATQLPNDQGNGGSPPGHPRPRHEEVGSLTQPGEQEDPSRSTPPDCHPSPGGKDRTRRDGLEHADAGRGLYQGSAG